MRPGERLPTPDELVRYTVTTLIVNDGVVHPKPVTLHPMSDRRRPPTVRVQRHVEAQVTAFPSPLITEGA